MPQGLGHDVLLGGANAHILMLPRAAEHSEQGAFDRWFDALLPVYVILARADGPDQLVAASAPLVELLDRFSVADDGARPPDIYTGAVEYVRSHLPAASLAAIRDLTVYAAPDRSPVEEFAFFDAVPRWSALGATYVSRPERLHLLLEPRLPGTWERIGVRYHDWDAGLAATTSAAFREGDWVSLAVIRDTLPLLGADVSPLAPDFTFDAGWTDKHEPLRRLAAAAADLPDDPAERLQFARARLLGFKGWLAEIEAPRPLPAPTPTRPQTADGTRLGLPRTEQARSKGPGPTRA